MQIKWIGAFFLIVPSLILANEHTCKITHQSVDAIQLGMKVKTLARLPNIEIKRIFDGDGIPLIEVYKNKIAFAVIYAGEENPEQKMNLNQRIISIETFNKNCFMENGIHPGMPLKELTNILGADINIQQYEIEQREYIQSSVIEDNMFIRVDGAGIYQETQTVTSKIHFDATVVSIGVAEKE